MFSSASLLHTGTTSRGVLRKTVTRYLDLARERRALARLDDRQLADIGITREDASRELSRPFWDVPHRRC